MKSPLHSRPFEFICFQQLIKGAASMYVPSGFAVQDPECLARFIAQNSFATLISQDESGLPFASHVPLLFEPQPGPGFLLGHLARANAQWGHFEGQRPVLAIFHGPHAYISPRWYATGPAVPTWNYAAVHAYGTPKLIAEDSRLEALVRRLIRFYEPQEPPPADLPTDFLARQLKGIVGFEIRLTRLEGKFKLGQNRPAADVAGVYEALSQSTQPGDRLLAQFMNEQGIDGKA